MRGLLLLYISVIEKWRGVTDATPRCFDLAMKEIFNAKERDIDDWTHLFHLADSRFEIAYLRQPATSQLAIIEVIWRNTGITASHSKDEVGSIQL